jgi:hypothetical protein
MHVWQKDRLVLSFCFSRHRCAGMTTACLRLHPVTEKTFRIVGGVLRAGVNQTQPQLI